MANKALAVNPSTGAIVAPVTATTFRNANGLQIGLNIQAWSADLDSFVTNASWSGTTLQLAGALKLATSLVLANQGAGSFDVFLSHDGFLSANRSLSINLGDGNRTVSLAGDFATAGSSSLTLTTTGATNVTIPTSGTLATLSGTETLTGKIINLGSNTLTATSAQLAAAVTDETGSGALVFGTSPVIGSPDINAGTVDSLTSLSVRNTSGGAFDVTIAHTGTLSSGRTLTLNLNDAARSVSLSGDITLAASFATSGANGITLTTTGATNVTLPTTGTLSTLAGAETFTNKLIQADDGSVGSPAYAFDSDTDCGRYRIGANNYADAVAGVKLVEYAADLMTVTGQIKVAGASAGFIIGSRNGGVGIQMVSFANGDTSWYDINSAVYLLTLQNSAGQYELYPTTTETTRLGRDGNRYKELYLGKTNTAGGTTGNQTINKSSGSVNFAASATALTVTNSLVTANSIVMAVAATNDSTAQVKNVVPAAGSFVINLAAAATAETKVSFLVLG